MRSMVAWPLVLLMGACAHAGPSVEEPLEEVPAASSSGRTVRERELKGTRATSVEELLAARFPGVEVLRAPGGLLVRIRGASTVTGSGEPLYVIDGMPIEPGVGGALMGINPSDITGIKVLKDVGYTALYGGRGANGVVLITTRR